MKILNNYFGSSLVGLVIQLTQAKPTWPDDFTIDVYVIQIYSAQSKNPIKSYIYSSFGIVKKSIKINFLTIISLLQSSLLNSYLTGKIHFTLQRSKNQSSKSLSNKHLPNPFNKPIPIKTSIGGKRIIAYQNKITM